jgi:hypothetical protein
VACCRPLFYFDFGGVLEEQRLAVRNRHNAMNSSNFRNLQCALLPSAMVAFLALSSPARSALIGHWTFNEGAGGTAKDTSGHGNDGALMGGATYVSSPGLFGLSITARGQHVEVPGSSLWNPQAGALSAIAWVTTSNGTGGPIGNEKQMVGIPSRIWSLGLDKSEEKFMMIGDLTSTDPGIVLASTATNVITDGVQYMAGFSKDVEGGNQLKFWLDGVKVSESGGTGAFEDSATAGTSATPVVQIGICCGDNTLEGVIDEVRIYDHQLSQAEIDVIYAAGPSLVTNPITPIVATFIDVTASKTPGVDNDPLGWNDYNQDGFPDYSSGGPLNRNDGGTGFVSAGSGFGFSIWADWDNDGDQDSFNLNLLAQPKFMRTDGIATFVELPVPPLTGGMDNQGACWADFNGDTYLDIYVGAYEETGYEPDSVLINNAGASFTRVLVESGGDRPGRGVTACDFDEDGDMDVFVSNYRLEANYLWRNNGSGTFTDAAPALSADGLASSNPTWNYAHTIGSAWGDMNNDGHFDIMVGNFAHPEGWCGGCARQPESEFLENQGPPTYNFVDRAGIAGLHYQESYASPSLADYDNDGDLDLYLSTVNGGDEGVLYRNDGNWSFSDVTAQENLSGLAVSSQSAWADYNDDGFLDLMAAGKLFENQGNSNHWLKVRMEGDSTNINRSAIGAQGRIDLGGGTVLARQVEAGTGHGNQNSPTLHFGLGTRTAPVTLNVFWPDGTSLNVSNVAVDQTEFVSYAPSPPPIVLLSQATIGDVDGICFTAEVGKVYGLYSADLEEGPYSDTSAGVTGTGGVECLFDPNSAGGVDPGKFYEVRKNP